MQPTLPTNLDLPGVQSIDRMHLLALFWQQRALAERDMNSAKETADIQLETGDMVSPDRRRRPSSADRERAKNDDNNNVESTDNGDEGYVRNGRTDLSHEDAAEREDRRLHRLAKCPSRNTEASEERHQDDPKTSPLHISIRDEDERQQQTEALDMVNLEALSKSLHIKDEIINIIANSKHLLVNGESQPQEIAAKNERILLLIAEFTRLSSTIMSMKQTHGHHVGKLQQCLEAKQQQIEQLETKLRELSSQEEADQKYSKDQESDFDSKRSNAHSSLRSSPAASPDIPAKRELQSPMMSQSMDKEHGMPNLPYFQHSPLRIPGYMNNHGHPFMGGLPFPGAERPVFRFGEDFSSLSSASMVGRLGDSLIPKGDPIEAKLQEMLRFNLEKFANQNLDTLHISRRVRELLSVHNIGQRIFAKYVLGLSQGTVSELLSKPKPWDKLTEKGRDSYRKMHAWIVDNQAVMLIKSLVPKRVSGVGENSSDRMSASPSDNKNDEVEDTSAEKLSRHSLDGGAKVGAAFPGLLFPHLFASGLPPMQDENLRLTFENYQRELLKLHQQQANMDEGSNPLANFPSLPNILAMQQQALNGFKDLAKDNAPSNGHQEEEREEVETTPRSIRPKVERGPTPTTNTTTAPSPLGNSILPPAVTPTEDFGTNASPLQRMASITNSLITQPPVTPHHNSQQRPMKAVLPPITQQQFDLYNNLNTEDIVRRIKEALSQYSISQRLFGESVLGLSQGSVSDLLARPKPWHMLTQKGREPFIRMNMFLEDDNAVHKLVASQYKIAPEKLMRTGNYSGNGPVPPSMLSGKQMPPMTKMISEQISKMQEQQQQAMHQLQQHQNAQNQLVSPNSQHSQSHRMLLTPPGHPPHHAIPLSLGHQLAENNKKSFPLPGHSPQPQTPQGPPPQHSPNVMRGLNQHMSPTVYEMAALTQDLDTQVITTKIKEALLANNIGQKIFGEAVLGLSQGSVSELLSKPKPWHMLSIKGREPFIRMQLWLNDTNNVDRLQALKNERREASKRRRSTGPGGQDNSSDTSSNDTSEFYHCTSPGPASVGSSASAPPNKKQRVLFSEEQKEALRLAFALEPYPNVSTTEFLANELNLTTRTITNWFHNHRMRLKQQVPHGLAAENVPSRDNQSNQPFDPVHFRILLNQRLMEAQKDRMGLNGLPLQYNPYFAANPNLAALISRGLLPGANEADLAALNKVFKEQMRGLDLSLKRDGDEDFEESDNEENGNEGGSEAGSAADREEDEDNEETEKRSSVGIYAGKQSRRKANAPQWVNPDWLDDNMRSAEPEVVLKEFDEDHPPSIKQEQISDDLQE